MNKFESVYITYSNKTLPKLLVTLKLRKKNPVSMKKFVKKGFGKGAIFKEVKNHFKLESKEDISGAYMFTHKGQCMYIGISDEVCRRVNQHLKGRDHYSASLAYLIAKKGTKAKGTRDEIMKSKGFEKRFKNAKEKISTWDLTIIEVKDPIARYLFEVYASLELASKNNQFETH